ncbi:hypothetical protein AU184_04690 [Mycolicibacterium novocastrense]|uniref:hypothetical protein n=1 Tax=Mycolicibacterium novocastrense TaxID=59813 RepID=UPI000747105F|nr:hypothetical protein [Mycolicibacterium novocastrense]KUH73190.1 hypothetical protein AU072_00955 [Mycolicibacterium novocastrense]KUH74273.1 hypothetical protein AU183_12950 [Mycolicibacterium novocastrense]KUH75268.1 hypothetical protein AU184_04690 [Mycolicibacterium novocastrense]
MPWQPSYASAAELAGWLGVDEDPELALATEAASRAIDQATGRQFGLLSSSEFRWYTSGWFRDRWIIPIDDLMTNASLLVEVDNDQDGTPEAEITDYRLTPVNAAANGRPWTRIEVLPSSQVKPNGLHHGVRVSARWGWTNVPSAIHYACLVQAARFYDRRHNVGGTLAKQRVDDVEYGWDASATGQELDPDVLASIAGYRRLWGAM